MRALLRMWPDFAVPALMLMLFGLALVAGRPSLNAQKAERGTQQWSIPFDKSRGDTTLTVFDTAGVCLYVAQQSPWAEAGIAIAAVPKTALPAGTGCQ